MKKEDEKTNVMRILDQKKVKYIPHSYDPEQAISGTEVAAVLGQDVERVFKTLVTTGKTGNHYVFVIPVAEELDLKKAAKAVGEKSIEMLKSKELLPLTGYIHGGCSPIGMKKFFRTVFHVPSDEAQSAGKRTAYDYETIFFSAGKVGYQVELPLEELKKVIRFETADIIVENN